MFFVGKGKYLIRRNPPQFSSSDASKQSSVKSHCLSSGIHSPLLQGKFPAWQVTFSAERNIVLQLAVNSKTTTTTTTTTTTIIIIIIIIIIVIIIIKFFFKMYAWLGEAQY